MKAGSGGLDGPVSMAFGPDGNLYVANSIIEVNGTAASILRYNGKTGAFMDTFIAPGTGGLLKPLSVVFGPHGDLFVGSAEEQSFRVAKPHTSSVLRYDGTTGVRTPEVRARGRACCGVPRTERGRVAATA